MTDSNDPKHDRVINTLEIPNVFDPKVAQELFDEAMAENGKKAALIAQKDAEIAELKKNFKEEVRQFGYHIISFIVLFALSTILNVCLWISLESEGQEISNTTEKTVASDKINTSSFDAAAKGRALTLEELADYEYDRVADRGIFLASWYDKERIVVVNHNNKQHYLKLTQDVYSALKNKSGYALDVHSAIYLLEEGFIDERDRDRAKAKEKAREFMRSQEEKKKAAKPLEF